MVKQAITSSHLRWKRQLFEKGLSHKPRRNGADDGDFTEREKAKAKVSVPLIESTYKEMPPAGYRKPPIATTLAIGDWMGRSPSFAVIRNEVCGGS